MTIAGTTTVTENFTIRELGRVRSLVARAGALIGLTRAVIDNLVVAVNEITTNAVRYAGGRGWITVRSGPSGISVEVADDGPGLPRGLANGRVAVDAVGGRGLWMARRLCRQLTIASTYRGTTVRLVAVHA